MTERSIADVVAEGIGFQTALAMSVEGEHTRAARLRHRTLGSRMSGEGVDHMMVVSLGGHPSAQRWEGRKLMGRGTPVGGVSTMAEFAEASWLVDEWTDAFHIYVPDALLRDAYVEIADADPSALAVSNVFGHADPFAHHLARAALVELERPSGAPSLMMDTLGLVFARHLAARYSNRALPEMRGERRARGPLDARLVRAMDYAMERLAEPVTLDEMAGAANMSRFHFSRAFRAALGEPPHRWLTARRVDHAKPLLANPELPLAQIAFACGFSSHSHFGDVFRAHTGMTPGAYRAAS